MLYRSVFLGLILLHSLSSNAGTLTDFNQAYQALLLKHTFSGEMHGIKSQLVHYKNWSLDNQHNIALKALSSFEPQNLAGDERKAF